MANAMPSMNGYSGVLAVLCADFFNQFYFIDGLSSKCTRVCNYSSDNGEIFIL